MPIFTNLQQQSTILNNAQQEAGPTPKLKGAEAEAGAGAGAGTRAGAEAEARKGAGKGAGARRSQGARGRGGQTYNRYAREPNPHEPPGAPFFFRRRRPTL